MSLSTQAPCNERKDVLVLKSMDGIICNPEKPLQLLPNHRAGSRTQGSPSLGASP